MNLEKQQEISDFIHEVQNQQYRPLILLDELRDRQEARVEHFRREKQKRFDDLFKSSSYFIPLELRKQSYSISSRNLEKELLLLKSIKQNLTNETI